MFLRPDLRVRDVTVIPPAALADRNLVVLDLDNTLVLPETTEVPDRILRWVRQATTGRAWVCTSNSPTVSARREVLEHILGVPVLGDGWHRKPFRGLVRELDARYRLRERRVVVIGDRLFTDIAFGKRLGARTILTEPLSPRESPLIRAVRLVERLLLR